MTLLINEMKKRIDIDTFNEIKMWVNKQSEQGYTALHYAVYKGNIKIVKILIEYGANIDITNKRGLNVFHMSAHGNQVSSLVYLKDTFNFDLHSTDYMGSTALHWACYIGSENAVVFLLSWNAGLNTQDKEGYTALHLAVISGNTFLIEKEQEL
jgi:palmitoyltransferase